MAEKVKALWKRKSEIGEKGIGSSPIVDRRFVGELDCLSCGSCVARFEV